MPFPLTPPSKRVVVAPKYRDKMGSRGSGVEKCTSKESLSSELGAQSQIEDPSQPTLTPFNFCQSWAEVAKGGGGLEEKARLLRSVRPHLLRAVIGNKLEDSMLSDFLACLSTSFSVQSEAELIIEYLTAIMQLERFSIIYSFLTDQQKSGARNLMEMLRPNVNQVLLRAYL